MAKRKLSEEQRAEMRARLARGRAKAAANREAKGKASDATRLELSDLSSAAADSGIGGDNSGGPHAGNDALAEVIAEEAAARRQRLLGDLDPETAALYTDAELAEIEREENEKALAARKKQGLQDIRATARQLARVENDLIPADTLRSEAEVKRLSEPVKFRVMLPGDGAGHRGRNGFRVDGYLFQVGREYTRSRAVFESLLSNHWRAWLNEVTFKTLDQHKAGNSAVEILNQTLPRFEVANAA